MNTYTLSTLARLLAPWRTIRRLWSENRRLQRSNSRLVGMVLLASSKNVAQARRLHNCPTHGQQSPNAWGCPECVRELRQEAEYLRGDLATAREAVRRLVRWNLEAYNSEVVRGVYLWATLDRMAGPLPPLPERLARREQREEESHG
jgi:hypothetical protein